MGKNNNMPFVQTSRRLMALGTAVVLVVALLFLVQSLVVSAAGTGTTAAPAGEAADPVITPTVSFDDAFSAYIEAHTVDGNHIRVYGADPEPSSPAEQTPSLEATGVLSGADYGVSLSADVMRMGAPGEVVTFTLTLTNVGKLTDTIDISAVSDWSTNIPVPTYTLTGGQQANVTVGVVIPDTAVEGMMETATITAASQNQITATDTAVLSINVQMHRVYLPVMSKPLPEPPTPSLSATRPNSANDWQMNWSVAKNNEFITGYELQESQDPTFTEGVSIIELNNITTYLVDTHEPSWRPIYYYRVRSIINNEFESDWSNRVRVVSAYYDEFDDNTSGWSRRRVTHIDETTAWYEIDVEDDKDWLIVQSLDSWDWVIASPLVPAPTLPYAIEYRSKVANLGNLVSQGAVFGADWNGDLCPDTSSIEGWYEHTACFNHFYNTNTIWYGPLKMLFERVDYLEWRPQDGGSPMKRGSFDDFESWFIVDPINNVDSNDWNTWRIEVREDGLKLYANGSLFAQTDDTLWVNEPYFGIFASTDEYSNSTARIEYYRVTPLDE